MPAGALGNVLAIGASQVHVPLPFGTVLTNPALFVTANVGSGLAIPIPNNIALAGALASAQGLSVTSTGGILLSNALDIQVGDF